MAFPPLYASPPHLLYCSYLQRPGFVLHPRSLIDSDEVEWNSISDRQPVVLEVLFLLGKFLANLTHHPKTFSSKTYDGVGGWLGLTFHSDELHVPSWKLQSLPIQHANCSIDTSVGIHESVLTQPLVCSLISWNTTIYSVTKRWRNLFWKRMKDVQDMGKPGHEYT